MGMEQFKGQKVIINAVTEWGKVKYSISFNGRAQVSNDKAAWEKAVQELRDAGAIIVDKVAIKAEQDAALAEMRARLQK